MYKVVEFNDDDGYGGELGVVREEWMTPRKTHCMWPPYKTANKFNKCLNSNEAPNMITWTLCPIKRLFYETDNLLKARQKCKKAESESELATDQEEDSRKRKKKTVCESDSESDGENETEKYIKISYPKPPNRSLDINDSSSRYEYVSKPNKKLTRQDFNVDDSPMPNSPHSKHTHSKTISVPSNIKNSTSRYEYVPTKKLSLQDFNVDDSPMPNSPHSVDTQRNSPVLSTHSTSQPLILTEINSSIAKIAKYLGEITSAIKELQHSQREVLSRLSTTSAAIPERLPDNVSLPLKSGTDITSLEVWLENEENKELLINYLTYIGGNKTGPITRRILERIFDNNLATKCNWTGKNNKIAIKDLQVTKVIIGAVRKNKAAEKETDHGITEIIVSWFRFAKDRDGGRESRRARSN